MQPFAWLLARRYLGSRWVNVLGTLGVAVAVWALILVRAVFSGFIGNIQDDVRLTSPQLLLTGLPLDTGYERLRQALERDQDVAATAPRLRHFGVYFGLARAFSITESQLVDFSNARSAFVQLLGIDAVRERAVTRLDEWYGRVDPSLQPPPLDQEAGERDDPIKRLHVPARLEWEGRRHAQLPVPPHAEDWHTRWPGLQLGEDRRAFLRVGDPVDVVSVRYRQAGDGIDTVPIREKFTYAGAFRTRHRVFDETTAIVPIETVRAMLGQEAADADSIDLVTDVAIRLHDGAATAPAAARLLAAVRPLLPPDSRPEVIDWQQQNAVFLDAVAHERALMQLVLFVVMLVAAFLVYATLHMMVAQKIKDIGVLAAMGASPRAIGGTFLLCGLVVGALGAGLGTVLGVQSTLWINPVNDWLYAHFEVEMFPRRLFDLPEIPCRLEPPWIAAVPAIALLLTLLVAWLPARRAARTHPVEALSYE